METQVSRGKIHEPALIRVAASALVPVDHERAFAIMRWLPEPEESGQLSAFTATLIEHGMPPLQALNEASELLTSRTPEQLMQGTIRRLGDAGRRDEAKDLVDHWYTPETESWIHAMLGSRPSLGSGNHQLSDDCDWILDQVSTKSKPMVIREVTKSLTQWERQVTNWIESIDDVALRDHAYFGLIEGLIQRHEGGAHAHLERIQSEPLKAEATALIGDDQPTNKSMSAWDLSEIGLGLEP